MISTTFLMGTITITSVSWLNIMNAAVSTTHVKIVVVNCNDASSYESF